MPVIGTPVFNGLEVIEVEIDFFKDSMTAKAAYINTKTGYTHGWTSGGSTLWSKETKEKLTELKKLMELDMAKKHFGDAAPAQTDKPGLTPPSEGLGEHVSGRVPSV